MSDEILEQQDDLVQVLIIWFKTVANLGMEPTPLKRFRFARFALVKNHALNAIHHYTQNIHISIFLTVELKPSSA